MRLVHLADIHLGFRQYQRQTPAGINQREADVAASMRRTLDTDTRMPLSGPPGMYGLPGTAMITTEIGHPFGQTLKLCES